MDEQRPTDEEIKAAVEAGTMSLREAFSWVGRPCKETSEIGTWLTQRKLQQGGKGK